MDEEGKPPRFWLHAGHRRSSSNLNTSTLFMLIVPTAALLLLLFTFSSVPSLSSQILNPNSVKKTWDSLNLLLVLFAIFCGTFARWNEDDGGSTECRDQVSNDHQPQQPSSHQLKWYELSSYDSSMRATTSGRGGLRRSSSSYPDLRQQSNWETTGEHGFRYYDDFEIARINQLLEIQPEGIVGQGRLRINADPDTKLNSYPSKQDSEARPASSRANPPSSPPPPLRQKKTRAHRSVPRIERLGIQNAAGTAHKLPQIENKEEVRHSLETGLRKAGRRRPKDVPGKDGGRQKSSVAICTSQPLPPVDVTSPLKDEHLRSASETTSLHHPQDPKVKLTVPKQKTETESETQAVPSPPPRLLPPPPPPIPPSTIWRPEQAVKKEGKKSSAKREIAMVWASIYKRKKKQNQPEEPQQPGREDSGNYKGISELFCEPEFSSTTQLCPHPSPPPPPPPLPPPPHSVLHSFFRKTGSKKIHSVPAPPPPPPRLPRQSFITQVTPRPRSSAGKPPLPKRPSSYRKDEYRYASSSGSESPVADIPRPPPLPPFGVPETRFVVRGGFARTGKNSSWRSEELSEFEGESLAMEWSGGEADVNAKAETFIARLRGEWRLEKMNDT